MNFQYIRFYFLGLTCSGKWVRQEMFPDMIMNTLSNFQECVLLPMVTSPCLKVGQMLVDLSSESEICPPIYRTELS